ncbi:endonuclease/exonuclease/phosphatase family protein [Marinimicrobium sp. C2-29]|uniref:endonuclease/exonuclease/phosphatase family protein n=1 Tax=Marinimicrobium sp. C2-29 TaxID=3139825 RepID=UPI003139732F
MPSISNSTTAIVCRLLLAVLSSVLVFATLIAQLPGNAWWIRIFDFPRIQIAVLIVVTLAGYGWLYFQSGLRLSGYMLAGALALALGLQLYFIAPYTPLYPTQMQESLAENDDNRVSLLIFNVLHDNREVEALRRLIRSTNPDVILLSEPTHWWLEQLEGLEADYPHTLFAPQENKYGMLLYSRFELIDPEIRFLVQSKIPSFRVKLQLRSGQEITLYGVHPRPPGLKREASEAGSTNPQNASHGDDENEKTQAGEREDSDVRDAELQLVAKEVAKNTNKPVIVGGDFNDVAWSHSTGLFQRIGGFIDPRIGRGLYNSFNAKNPIMRYPLDHVFASGHFRFVELRRLPAIGSDHFPMLVVLDFDPSALVQSEELERDAGDEEESEEAIEEGTDKG